MTPPDIDIKNQYLVVDTSKGRDIIGTRTRVRVNAKGNELFETQEDIFHQYGPGRIRNCGG